MSMLQILSNSVIPTLGKVGYASRMHVVMLRTMASALIANITVWDRSVKGLLCFVTAMPKVLD